MDPNPNSNQVNEQPTQAAQPDYEEPVKGVSEQPAQVAAVAGPRKNPVLLIAIVIVAAVAIVVLVLFLMNRSNLDSSNNTSPSEAKPGARVQFAELYNNIKSSVEVSDRRAASEISDQETKVSWITNRQTTNISAGVTVRQTGYLIFRLFDQDPEGKEYATRVQEALTSKLTSLGYNKVDKGYQRDSAYEHGYSKMLVADGDTLDTDIIESFTYYAKDKDVCLVGHRKPGPTDSEPAGTRIVKIGLVCVPQAKFSQAEKSAAAFMAAIASTPKGTTGFDHFMIDPSEIETGNEKYQIAAGGGLRFINVDDQWYLLAFSPQSLADCDTLFVKIPKVVAAARESELCG